MSQRPTSTWIRSGDAAYVINQNQCIVEWNEEATRLLGFHAEEALGQRCWQLLRGADQFGTRYCTYDCSIKRQLADGNVARTQHMMLRHKAGHFIPAEMSTVIVSSDHGTGHNSIVHIMRPRQAERAAFRSLQVFMLGPLEILRPDGNRAVESIWQREKVRTLTAILLSHVGQRVTREFLTETIWPEMDYSAALRNLNTTVHMLRRALDSCENQSSKASLIAYAGGNYRLSSDVVIWFDTDAFERRLRQAAAEPNSQLALTLYQDALQLYRGDYLSDLRFSPAWSAGRHFRYQEMYVSALEDMGLLYERIKQPREAEQCYLRALEVDPYCESSLQKLILLLVAGGRRAVARQLCLRTRHALAQNLEMNPSEIIATLCRTLSNN